MAAVFQCCLSLRLWWQNKIIVICYLVYIGKAAIFQGTFPVEFKWLSLRQNSCLFLAFCVFYFVFCIWFHIKKVGIFQPGFQPSSNEVLWQNSSPPHATLPARVATLLSTTSCFCRKPARLEIQMKTNIWSDPILSKDFVEPKGKGEEDFSLCVR